MLSNNAEPSADLEDESPTPFFEVVAHGFKERDSGPRWKTSDPDHTHGAFGHAVDDRESGSAVVVVIRFW